MSLRKIIQNMIREEYDELVKDNQIKEGIVSWAGGVADNVLYSIINNYKSIRQTDIFKDPKIRGLARTLKISQKELEDRVSKLVKKDRAFLKALATQRYTKR